MARYRIEAQKHDGAWKLAVMEPEGVGHKFVEHIRYKDGTNAVTFATRDKAREARKHVRFLDTSLANGRLKSRNHWLDREEEKTQPVAAE